METAGADTNNRASSLKWKYRLDIWLQILKETKKRSNAFLLFMFSVLQSLAVDFFFRWQTCTAWNVGKCSAKAVGSEIRYVACAARKHGASHHGRQAFRSSRLHHVSISMRTQMQLHSLVNWKNIATNTAGVVWGFLKAVVKKIRLAFHKEKAKPAS